MEMDRQSSVGGLGLLQPGFYPATSSSEGIADGGGIWLADGARALERRFYRLIHSSNVLLRKRVGSIICLAGPHY